MQTTTQKPTTPHLETSAPQWMRKIAAKMYPQVTKNSYTQWEVEKLLIEINTELLATKRQQWLEEGREMERKVDLSEAEQKAFEKGLKLCSPGEQMYQLGLKEGKEEAEAHAIASLMLALDKQKGKIFGGQLLHDFVKELEVIPNKP